MIRRLLRSVIRNATVTATHDAPSLRLDRVLMNAMEVRAFEEIDVINNSTGARYTTWVEEGQSGEVRVAHVRAGDVVTILSSGLLHDGQTLAHKARVVTVSMKNELISIDEQ
ncbi:MAG TPA: aspartate 1-decarboxylase [Thermoanaerobaculia bacterium]|nr:aspartate 1-decarboxylase [Thermoanaerobaculia bacterium]